MKNAIRIMSLTLVLCVLLCGCGARIDRITQLRRWDDAEDAAALNALAAEGYQGRAQEKLTVAVVRDGQAAFFNFGGASEDDHFELGLLSGMFTAMTAVRYLDPDAPAQKYFGEEFILPTWDGEQFTVRQLLTQSAGLQEWPDHLPQSDDPCVYYSDKVFLTGLEKNELLYQPGTESRDSPMSIALLGNLIEWRFGGNTRCVKKISGNVFSRAHMYYSAAQLPGVPLDSWVQGHEADGTALKHRHYNSLGAAVGFGSTGYDLAMFLASCLGQATVDDGTTPRWDDLADQAFCEWYNDGTTRRGACCNISDLGFGDVFWQESVFAGNAGYIGFCRDTGVGVAVLSNYAVSVTGLGEQLLTAASN